MISRYGNILIAALLFSPSFLYSFGKNKVNYETYRWKIIKTIHFDIHYPEGMEELGLKAADIAEEGYVYISNYLRHELTESVPVIVFPSHIAFQNNNIMPSIVGEGTGGFTESLKSRVVIPYTGSDDNFRHVLVHEIVHAFQFNILFADRSGEKISRLSHNVIPLWIAEGMAEYLSIGFDETADMVMRDALYNEKYSSLKDLTLFRVRNIYMIYKEGQSFFYFLEKRYGRERAGELFKDFRDLVEGGLSIDEIDEILKINTGKDLKDLNKEWIRFYKKRYFHLVKDKNFDDEEGEQITFHEKTRSSMNICPVVSPDGKKLAYITNRDIYPSLVIRSIEKKKERDIKVLIKGASGARFEGMHLMTNYLTWSQKSNTIAFVAQSNGRDVIYLLDPVKGSIKEEIILPMRDIRDTAISKDGRFIVFIGSGNGAADIYIYDMGKKRLKRVTDDNYTERYPRIIDEKNIIFSSNRKAEGMKRPFYNIYKINIETGKTELLIKSFGNDLQADISPDGEKIIYISNRSGIYNAYTYNLKTGENIKITDVLSGVFYPRWFPKSKKIAFVSYQNAGYDIFIKDLSKGSEIKAEEKRDTEYSLIRFPDPYFPLAESVFGDYNPAITSDIFSFGFFGVPSQWLVCFGTLTLSDRLGDHRIILTANYIRSDGEGSYNYDAAYYYLKHRWDFGIGIFRQKNPFWIYSLSSVNDIIHNVNYGMISMDRFGGYGVASYPFSRFFRFNIQTTISRYEKDFSVLSNRPDIYANLNLLSLSLNYDNVLWGRMVPADGFRGRVGLEHAFDLTGQDCSFSKFDADLRRYFLLGKKYIFAFRGTGGKIFGKESYFFKYYIGGYNTVRGHPFLEYRGKNMFVFNAEFRFIFIEGIKFGWPLFFGIGNIGGVLFADMGSAWDNDYNFIDKETGMYDDLKAGYGFGFRFTIYPIIIIKLDYAWPYYKKSTGKKDIIFSIGFEY